jgi:amidase
VQSTSAGLTEKYLRHIERLNPLLHAVIETNPDALEIATRLDAERRQGHVRSSLHGIPILVKDNLATADKMQTTAGLTRFGRQHRAGRLRRGAEVARCGRRHSWEGEPLGVGELPRLCAFQRLERTRRLHAQSLSAALGSVRLQFRLSRGSRAFLCAPRSARKRTARLSAHRETISVSGSSRAFGLVAQDGIIPIAHSQDTAGPITRTVTDAAILLGIIQTPMDGVPPDYTPYLKRGSLQGARIGMDKRYFTRPYGGELDLIEVVKPAIDVMRSLGATVIITDTGDSNLYFDAEFTVLLFEFKVQIAEYLATLTNTSIATLADLIQFDLDHCPEEMKYFGQEIFELSEATSGDLMDPEYLAARALCLQLSRDEGIDAALERDDLDAIIAPSYSFASSPAAVAGYPNISIPIGLTSKGKPAGIWMYGGYLQEAKLISYAYDLEQEIQPRTAPQFIPPLPHEPPDAGLCIRKRRVGNTDTAAALSSRHRQALPR